MAISASTAAASAIPWFHPWLASTWIDSSGTFRVSDESRDHPAGSWPGVQRQRRDILGFQNVLDGIVEPGRGSRPEVTAEAMLAMTSFAVTSWVGLSKSTISAPASIARAAASGTL